MTEYIIHVEDAKTLYGGNTDFTFPLDAYLREEIVRCIDCKYFRIGLNYDVCAFTDKYTRHDGFCSWAERKDVEK